MRKKQQHVLEGLCSVCQQNNHVRLCREGSSRHPWRQIPVMHMDHPHHGMYHPEKPKEIIVPSCRAATTPRALWNIERLYALLELSLPQAAPTMPSKGQQMITENMWECCCKYNALHRWLPLFCQCRNHSQGTNQRNSSAVKHALKVDLILQRSSASNRMPFSPLLKNNSSKMLKGRI